MKLTLPLYTIRRLLNAPISNPSLYYTPTIKKQLGNANIVKSAPIYVDLNELDKVEKNRMNERKRIRFLEPTENEYNGQH